MMTDNEILDTLMVRLGWSKSVIPGNWKKERQPTGEDWTRTMYSKALPFFESKDVVSGVLATLSPDEWFELVSNLSELDGFDDSSDVEMAKWLLTMEPRTLARAIALL